MALPAKSNLTRPERWPCSTSSVAAATVPISPIGRLNQKTVCQPKVVSQPPRIGPMIRPAPTTIALMPRARPSSRRGNASVTSAAELAIRNAPPTPWTSRAATSSSADGASAQATEATVNSAKPAV